jgi:hypothetical protein
MLAFLYIPTVIFAAAYLFAAVERLEPLTASPSSSNAPSSPQAERRLQSTCCLEGFAGEGYGLIDFHILRWEPLRRRAAARFGPRGSSSSPPRPTRRRRHEQTNNKQTTQLVTYLFGGLARRGRIGELAKWWPASPALTTTTPEEIVMADANLAQATLYRAAITLAHRQARVPPQRDRTAQRVLPAITRKLNVNGLGQRPPGREDRLCSTEAASHTRKV